jgi:hypothetical protein
MCSEEIWLNTPALKALGKTETMYQKLAVFLETFTTLLQCTLIITLGLVGL